MVFVPRESSLWDFNILFLLVIESLAIDDTDDDERHQEADEFVDAEFIKRAAPSAEQGDEAAGEIKARPAFLVVHPVARLSAVSSTSR